VIAIPWAVLVLLVVAVLAAGWLLGHNTDRHNCVICYKPLPRVCSDGHCGGTPGQEIPDGR
jgi:lipopolysaccharide export system protein LptC